MSNFTGIVALLLAMLMAADVRSAEPGRLRFVEPHEKTGSSRAVIVNGLALAHTAQLLPLDSEGRIVGKDDADDQIQQVLNNLEAALAAAGSGFEHAVKINIYVRRAKLVPDVQDALYWRFKGEARPAVSLVEGALAHPDALVAMDAVAAVPKGPTEVKRFRAAKLPGPRSGAHVAILPAGPHVYVSGQASPKGDDVAQATRQTLESLRGTLKFLELNETHVVQLKAFLQPMSAASAVEKEIAKFFGDQPVPPLVFVEWRDKLPIEIELVVASPLPKEKAREPIEFLTPPGMESSPVYSRVTRINHGKIVYISGLYGKTARDAEAQIQEIFAELGTVLEKSGSDIRHLAKATYYVADDAVGRQLTEFRKKHYDPRRPPAASKAAVAGVGFEGKVITVDMIAVAPSN